MSQTTTGFFLPLNRRFLQWTGEACYTSPCAKASVPNRVRRSPCRVFPTDSLPDSASRRILNFSLASVKPAANKRRKAKQGTAAWGARRP